MRARDVMTTQVQTVRPETSVVDIAKRLVEYRISAVPVIDAEGRTIGIVSEGDLMRRPETGGERQPSWWLTALTEPEMQARSYVRAHGGHARDVMTRELVTVGEDASLEEIATLLEKHRIKRVPVLRDGKLVGIVSRANLLQGIVARQHGPQLSTDENTLRERVRESIDASGARTELINLMVAGNVIHLWGAAYSDVELDAVELAASSVAGEARIESHLGVLSPRIRALLGAE